MQDWKTLINQLDDIRRRNKISQSQLARDIGWSRQQVSDFFKHRHVPNISKFIAVADGLGLNITFTPR